jgi:hypothetical protein
MMPTNMFLSSILRGGIVLSRASMLGALILMMILLSWGQTPAPNSGPRARKLHWHKYVSKDFRFSVWYPNTYKLSDFDGICKDNEYRRYLLCLQKGDDSDTRILVTIIVAVPFFVESNRGDVPFTPQRIGNQVFYCGWGGSMGTGFTDECTFNLRGKVLEFNFSPAETINSGKKTHPLGTQILKTFRVF